MDGDCGKELERESVCVLDLGEKCYELEFLGEKDIYTEMQS